MKKSTVIFIPTLSDGGAERVAVNLSNSLSLRGKKIILLTLKKNNNYKHEISSNVKLVELKSSRLLSSIYEISKFLVLEKPGYLISFLYASCIISVISKLLSFSDVKIIFSLHNNFEKSKNSIKSRLTLYCFKFFIKFSYKVIAVSKGLKSQIQNKFNIPEKKIHYIYNPIFKKNLITESLKKNYSLHLFKKNKINILIIGRLTKQKNQILIIKNLRKFKNLNKIQLFILGSGENLKLLKDEVLKNKLNSKVKFLGYKKNPYCFIRYCDYLLVPSLWEGFGNIIGEGLFFKKKIISSNCDYGPNEILEKGKYGYLFKVNSSKDLIKTFEKSFSDKRLIPNSIFLNQFKVSEVSKKYEELLI